MLVYYLAAVRRYCRSCVGKLALYQPPSEGARWSGLFASSDSLSSLGRLTGAGEFVSLSQWGTLSLGAVTGNNSFFVLNQSEFEQWGFASDDVLRLCPPGSEALASLGVYGKGRRSRRGTGCRGLSLSPWR